MNCFQMPRVVITCLLSVLATAAVAEPRNSPADIAWIAQGEFCEPESVLPLPDGTFLVSNVCGFATPGTGFLTLLDGLGRAMDWQAVTDLDAPLGMVFAKSHIFVIDSNRIKIFGWPDFTLIETIQLPTRVANDVAVAEDGSIYVTDTADHQVLRRSPDGEFELMGNGFSFTGANGLQLRDNDLYVGGNRLWRINLLNGEVTIVGPELLADIDGIEFEDDGTLQVTPVGGPLIRYRDSTDIQVISGEGISSANHGYAPSLNLALIPTGYDNTVIAIRIPE